MMSSNTPLSDTDRLIIERSKDLAITKKRMKQTVFMGILFLALFCGATFVAENRIAVLIIGAGYILITVYEKYSYGKAVLLYKSVIQKLSARLTAPEAEQAKEGVSKPPCERGDTALRS